MWYDKWDRKTLNYLGRFDIDASETVDDNFRFQKGSYTDYPRDNLEPGFYKIEHRILYGNKSISIVEKKISDKIYCLNGDLLTNYGYEDTPNGYLDFTDPGIRILSRVNIEEVK